MRERVVVVVAHRGQRDERGAVLRDGVGQPFDGLERRRQVRLPFGRGAFPGDLGGRDGVRVQLADRRHVAADAVRLACRRARDAADADVRRTATSASAARLAAERGDGLHERGELVLGVTPRSNAMRSILWSFSRLISSVMPALALGIGVSATTSCVADDADGDGGLLLVQRLQHGEEPVDVAADERMIGGVELRGAHARGEPPQQLFVLTATRDGCSTSVRFPILIPDPVLTPVRELRAPRRGPRRRADPLEPRARASQRRRPPPAVPIRAAARRAAAARDAPRPQRRPPVALLQRERQRLDRVGTAEGAERLDRRRGRRCGNAWRSMCRTR